VSPVKAKNSCIHTKVMMSNFSELVVTSSYTITCAKVQYDPTSFETEKDHVNEVINRSQPRKHQENTPITIPLPTICYGQI